MQTQIPTILEVTLRDGSYLIDFSFTSSDTAVLCAELERAGFSMIEIGHGIGLGAYRREGWRAAESDEGYMKAAVQSLRKTEWGMFCIPGIATLEDVDLAARYGMHFIRVGTNVNQIDESEPFIARAKGHGMRVYSNLMKSYALEPKEFAQVACRSRAYGADALYIVDSAGGMLPEDVSHYFEEVRAVSDIALGFHGHNNLDLAVANSLRALDCGAVIIDTSLQGMGRSAGNTPTETFLAVLQRRGIDVGVDLLEVMDLGEHYVRPLLSRCGYSSIDTIIGYAQFHSSYMSVIQEFSGKYHLDPRILIQEVCKLDRVNAPMDLVESVARQLVSNGRARPEKGVFTARYRLEQYRGGEQSAPEMAVPGGLR